MEEKSFGSSNVMQLIYEDDAGKPQTVYLQCRVGAVEGPGGEGRCGNGHLGGGYSEAPGSPLPLCRPHRVQQGVRSGVCVCVCVCASRVSVS